MRPSWRSKWEVLWVLAAISGVEQDLVQHILVAIVDLMENTVRAVSLWNGVGVEPILVHVGIEILGKAVLAARATLFLCFRSGTRGKGENGQGDGGTQGELHGRRF